MLRIVKTPKQPPQLDRRIREDYNPDIMLGRAVIGITLLVIFFLIYGVIKLNQ